MKITISSLRKIIKEEVSRLLVEGPDQTAQWNKVWEKLSSHDLFDIDNIDSFKKELSAYLSEKNKYDEYQINAFLENQGLPESNETFELAEYIASLYG